MSPLTCWNGYNLELRHQMLSVTWNNRDTFRHWWGCTVVQPLRKTARLLWWLLTKLNTPLAHTHQSSDQIRSAAQSCPTLCDPMNRSTPGLPVHHQLPEFTQTHIHRVSDAIPPSHPLSSPSPLAPSPSQHQSLFQWVNSSHEVAKVLEFQL